jgi:16S rRNA processing protein RimM
MSETTEKKDGDLVAVGRITGAHGIRGEVAVFLLTDFPERLDAGKEVLVETPQGKVSSRRILGSRGHADRLLLLLEGVPDRTAAEALRGGWLRVREEDLTPLPEGRYYRHDLVGMAVVTDGGEAIGAVHEILETGVESIVLVVQGPRGEILVPFVEVFVPRVDPAGRVITVNALDGLLPEPAAADEPPARPRGRGSRGRRRTP